MGRASAVSLVVFMVVSLFGHLTDRSGDGAQE
jgi:hypothetical protein